MDLKVREVIGSVLGSSSGIDQQIMEQLRKRGGEATAEELALSARLPANEVFTVVERLRRFGKVTVVLDPKLGIEVIHVS
jgi:hypothetical protein